MRATSASLCALAMWLSAVAWTVASTGGQGREVPPKADNRQVTLASEDGRTILRVDEREGDGVAWWPDLVMADGTIEVDIRGKDVMQRSFVGVAFHGLDEKTYDAIYFRPFNFRAADPARRAHAVQYSLRIRFTPGTSSATNSQVSSSTRCGPCPIPRSGFMRASWWRPQTCVCT